MRESECAVILAPSANVSPACDTDQAHTPCRRHLGVSDRGVEGRSERTTEGSRVVMGLWERIVSAWRSDVAPCAACCSALHLATCVALLGACDLASRESEPRLDPAVQRVGAAVYEARCASCHGVRGEGAADWKRPGPEGVYPPPPHDSTGHTWHHADGLLYRIVASGTARALGDTIGPSRYGMPSFDSVLSPREIHAVITHLKAGWTPTQRRHQAEASRADPFPDGALPKQ